MATAAIGSRTGLGARSTTDRVLLREFLEQDRLFAAYAICDLAEHEFGRTRWGIATDRQEVVAVGLEYSGSTPQPMFMMGRPDGITAIVRDVIRPRVAYVAARAEALSAIEPHYRVEAGPEMIRMAVTRATFQPLVAEVERLRPIDIHDLNRLYQLGFAAWLPGQAITEGLYYGIRVHGRLVAAAGTHVVSREAGLAVVGNVLTHAEHRGRGFAKAVTSAVTADLLRFCDDVVLNVRSDNPPAIAAYRRLGYREHCRFEERLARRTTPAWPDLAASFRRLFAGWRPGPSAPPSIDQARPMEPPAPTTLTSSSTPSSIPSTDAAASADPSTPELP